MFFFAILYALLKIITLFKVNTFILTLSSLSLSFLFNIRKRLLFYIKSIIITSISKNETISKNVSIFINSFSISLAIISICLIINYLNYKISTIEYISFSIFLAIISKCLIIDYLNYRVSAIKCTSFSIFLTIISKYLIIDYLNYKVSTIEYIN